MKTMNVGILGSGDVGKSLARGFLGLGQKVKIGSRSPEKLSDFVAGAGEGASAGTFEETAKFGDLLVLATLGTAAEEVIRIAGAGNFGGKVRATSSRCASRGSCTARARGSGTRRSRCCMERVASSG